MKAHTPKPTTTPAQTTAQAAEVQKPVQTAASTAMDISGPVALEATAPSEDLLRKFVPSPRARGAVGVKDYGEAHSCSPEVIEDLINTDPSGFASDDYVKAWGERAKGPLSMAAEEASSRAIQSGTVEDHNRAWRYHAGACSAHRAANDEARTSPGLFRDEWKYHFEKGMAHQDYVFAAQRGQQVNPRFQHLLGSDMATGINHDYLFDCVMFSTIRVQASTRKDAESQIREALDGADLNAGAWRNGDPILFTASLDGEIDLDAEQTIKGKEYAFDCKIMAAIRVNAVSVEDGETQLREALASGSINAGAWRNGDPIIFAASLDGALDLVEVDGEAMIPETAASSITQGASHARA
jgi:hypothetical protein